MSTVLAKTVSLLYDFAKVNLDYSVPLTDIILAVVVIETSCWQIANDVDCPRFDCLYVYK